MHCVVGFFLPSSCCGYATCLQVNDGSSAQFDMRAQKKNCWDGQKCVYEFITTWESVIDFYSWTQLCCDYRFIIVLSCQRMMKNAKSMKFQNLKPQPVIFFIFYLVRFASEMTWHSCQELIVSAFDTRAATNNLFIILLSFVSFLFVWQSITKIYSVYTKKTRNILV